MEKNLFTAFLIKRGENIANILETYRAYYQGFATEKDIRKLDELELTYNMGNQTNKEPNQKTDDE